MGILSHWQIVIVVSIMVSTTVSVYGAGNFNDEFEPTFGDKRIRVFGQSGKLLSLTLDKYSGSGFRSKKEYLYGRLDMQMKLVPGNSAGTVTTFYLSADQSTGRHDEIDFEFLGNVSGHPYTVHTNVFSQGKGNREQQFHLWFDPTRNFHTYSILWSRKLIMFLVDEIPLRIFRNHEKHGVAFPKNQPMRLHSSLWNADDWATQGGLVKTDWSKAPFTAYYRNFHIDACVAGSSSSSCAAEPETSTSSEGKANGRNTRAAWRSHDLDANGRKRLRWAHKYFKIYDYCNDLNRFPQGYPPECRYNRV
ncbi:probable xyloglucan endotransglucosylase/hydrolase protein 16 [Beta vulgaris subsp. vulgaris]|uniref:probable xyloglucan endotransglucosylase/hydrolase protein 16 n=1 Tax=Beta vulgaris subsp. vulgaris TaxID=3555 RepID=UPI002549043B|nr:probable xyloglucan endotransglucosylase/hydrolase protein 16 [Beta vulgaris subsp. vulgaris]